MRNTLTIHTLAHCALCREDPGAGNIISFFQFLFVSLEGLVFVSRFFQVAPVIPIRKYILMVSFYFFVSVVNNYALNFNIPLPLHMIFRSVSLKSPLFRMLCCLVCMFAMSAQCQSYLVLSQGSLVANMIMGILILKKR